MVTISTEFDINNLVCGRCTVSRDYFIVIADEKVYQFLGEASMHPLNRLVFEADREGFEGIFSEHKDNDPESVVVRIKRLDGKYRWCQVFVVHRNFIINDEVYTEIEIRDVISVNNRFFESDERINKYRNFLTLVNDRFFEYDFKTEIFRIYSYRANRSELIERDTLDEFEERVLRLAYVEDTAIPPFRQFCDNMRNGSDTFTVQFETSLLKKGERKEVLNFRGQTIFRGNERSMVVGLISTVNRRGTDKDFYYSVTETSLDSATNVMNKRAITEFIKSRINTLNAGGEKSSLYLVIVDIDNFKTANDTYGHMFGDEVISKLADVLKTIVGHRGTVGRIGGDEFLILLEDVADDNELRAILKTIRKNMEWNYIYRIPPYRFTCSMGVSNYTTDATDYETLFRIADKALYIAKDKGGDRFIIYRRDLHGELDNIQQEARVSQSVLPQMKTIEKSAMISELVLHLKDSGANGIQNVIDELTEKMSISGISVFTGKELICAYSSGFYERIISNASYIYNEKYVKLFNNYGIHVINNVEELSIDYKKSHNLLLKSNICSSVQIIIFENKQIKAMITFDIVGAIRRKWSEVDVSMLYIIAKIIGDAIALDKE